MTQTSPSPVHIKIKCGSGEAHSDLQNIVTIAVTLNVILPCMVLVFYSDLSCMADSSAGGC